jgi:hypothetical protein
MKPINVEITMGHNIGVSASYYKPTDREVMQDYLKAVDTLTIEGSKFSLEKRMREFSETSQQKQYVLQGKLSEKEKEMNSMKLQIETLMQWRKEVKEFMRFPEKLASIAKKNNI